jgi:sodium-dependent dicarboxylate transporter 2/3/5
LALLPDRVSGLPFTARALESVDTLRKDLEACDRHPAMNMPDDAPDVPGPGGPLPAGRLSAAEERFEAWRRRVGLVAGPALFTAIWLLPIPSLGEAPHRLLAVLAWVGAWWLSEAVPLAATGLLGPALCVLMGIETAEKTLRPFANPVIFLFLGGFLLAEAMMKHGLNRRVAFTVLSLPGVGNSLAGLYAGFGFLTAGVSAWISNTATAALMLPIAISVLTELGRSRDLGAGVERDWRELECSAGLVLVVAFAASVGGLATPIGTPPNLIGIGLLESTLARKVTFFEWMRFGVPLALGLTVFVIWRLHQAGKGRVAWPGRASEWIRTEASRLGPWSRAQQQVAFVFVLAVGLWLLPGLVALLAQAQGTSGKWLEAHLPEGVVAMLAAVTLFALPAGDGSGGRILNWSDATRIDWGTILLFGGGMALGGLAFSTGLAQWMGEGLAGALPWRSAFTLAVLFAVLGTCVSEATSNTASATMIVPLAISVAQAAGVEPLRPALAACLGCSLGFMLPVSTPPNAFAYGTGAVRLLTMVRHGWLLDVVGAVLVVAAVLFLGP